MPRSVKPLIHIDFLSERTVALAGDGLPEVRRRLRRSHIPTMIDARTGSWVMPRRALEVVAQICWALGGDVVYPDDLQSQQMAVGGLW